MAPVADARFEQALAGVLGSAAEPVLEAVRATPGAAFVGGWVRDVLLGRGSDDVDIAAPDPDAFVDSLHPSARNAVLMDPVRRTWRVTLGGGRWVDVTGLKGPTLAADLAARDLRVNAMAWAPGRGFLDPTGGLDDLFAQPRRLRLASPSALADDPLRVLRVWRFALQLEADVEVDIPAGFDLSGIANERIRAELLPMLGHADAGFALHGLNEAGLLAQVLPGPHRLDVHRRAAIVCAAHVGPNLARCWEHVGDQRAAVVLGWLCDVAELEHELVAQAWPRTLARAAASTSAEVGRTPAPGELGSDLVRWKCQTAYALLGLGAKADEPEALAARYLAPLDVAAGARNPKGLPIPPIPAPLLPAAEVRDTLDLLPGPQLGIVLGEMTIRQLNGAIADEADARAFLGWVDRVGFGL
ncbi:MAG: CCA tRNA nucleotidyltransferase [Proteobacteria bacterium]|nr:CCA tRNA nucleotidyltransferase [Pseudomonadota bacterium]